MQMRESAQNYLETILILQQRIGRVRSIDIANETGFTKPSVSVAMKQLRQNGYVVFDIDGYITLTDSGLKVAQSMYERHIIISKALMRLGVSEQAAIQDACRIEHIISDESFGAIMQHMQQNEEKDQ